MGKTIVTHMNPDLDALTAVWLLRRFGGEDWREAVVKFIPAGQTYKGEKVDSNPDVLHVDVGLGRFDHHQRADEKVCAATLVLDYLIKKSKQFAENEALKRLVAVVLAFDWAKHYRWPEIKEDRTAFFFFEHGIIEGWQQLYRNQSEKHLELALPVLDGIYENLKSKVEAERLIQEKAVKFKTPWGKGIGAETDIFGFLAVAQAQGYAVVVSKSPKFGYVRIHAYEFGKIKIDLSPVWEVLKQKDPAATWFLHAGKKLLLNGSRANPEMIPTKLSLGEIIEVLKNIHD